MDALQIFVLKQLNSVIIFVIDPEKEIKKQLLLYDLLKKEFKKKKIFIVINKLDLISKQKIKKLKKALNTEITDSPSIKGAKLKKVLLEEFKKSLKKIILKEPKTTV